MKMENEKKLTSVQTALAKFKKEISQRHLHVGSQLGIQEFNEQKKKLLTCNHIVEKFLHLAEKSQKTSRLAPQFLPSHRPILPAFADSPEGGANLLVGGANLLVTTV